MKKIFLSFMSLILIISISGCGESMFAGGGNDQSPEAVNSVVIKAFMDKDYDKILSLYSKNYNTFSDEAAHNYVAALLGKGGFDILNGVNYFIGDNKSNTNDMYSMFYTLIGIKANTINSQNVIANVKGFFDEAALVCNTVSCARLGGQITLNQGVASCSVKTANNTTAVLDNNTAFVCSLSGGFGTVTNISNTVQSLADKVGINTNGIDMTSQTGITEVINQLQTKGNLDSTIQQLTDDEVKDLANTLNNLNGNISNLENVVGNISEVDQLFSDFAAVDGEFTAESVRNGLNGYLTGLAGTNQ